MFSTDSDRIDFEVGSYRNPNPRRQRVAVYLDQNHMSTLSKAFRAPERVTAQEWSAAMKLIGWVGSGRILIPFSAAHLSETAAWPDTDARFHLATTILGVSRGWQLRDPLQQRVDEISSLITQSIGGTTAISSAVTLEPNAAIVSRVSPASAKDPEIDRVPALRHIFQSTLWFNVATSIMLDDAPVAKGSVGGWTASVQRFSDWLQGEVGRSKPAKRKAAAVFMFADESREAARAALNVGVTPEELSLWSRGSWQSEDRGRPAVSVFRSAMIDKIMSSHKWEANDLTDLMYLSTAAGYCDYVAGDRRTVALLRQTTRRLGHGAELHANLPLLVESLERRFTQEGR